MQFFIAFLAGIIFFYSFQYFPFFTVFMSLLSFTYLSVKKRFFLIFVLLSGIAFAFIRYEPVKDMPHFRDKVAVRGIFESYPSKTDSGMFKQNLKIKSAKDIKTGEELKEIDGKKIILFSDREFDPGTEFEIAIKFLKDRKRLNPGEQSKEYLYANLLDIYGSGHGRISLNSKIQEYRYSLNRYIEKNFKKDSGAFIASLTTGQRADMDEELRDAFSKTGLAHILSISGTHFGLFSMFLFGIFSFLIKALPYRILQRITIFLTPSQAAALFCLPFMFAYLGLSGASTPAVRSFIMIGLFMLGLIIGRKGFWLNSLAFAAFVLTLWEPEVIFTLSFQLSFLAVLFIGFSLGNKKDEGKEDRKVQRFLKNGLLLTLSASIGTAPLVAYYFHYLSIISPISNLVVTPLVGFILIPLSIVSSFLFLITGHYMFTPIVSAISDVSISLVRLFSNIPFADIKIPAFPPIIALLFYAGFIFYFLSGRPENADGNEKPDNFKGMPKQVRHDGIVSKGLKNFILNRALNLIHGSFQHIYRHFRGRKRYTLMIPFVPIIIYFSLSTFEKKNLAVTYLDVGQGDSSVIELTDGKTMVMDTGRTGRETASFLKYRGKKTIDALILSHVHSDHTGGLDYLIKRFKVKELWDNGRLIFPDTYLSDPSAKLWTGIKHRRLNRGDMIEGKGYSIYVFHPYPEFYTMYGNENVEADNDSLVLKIEGKNESFLFTGDIEEEAEEDILHLGRWLKSDGIKVPHHGGKTSSYEPFFEAVSPDVAIISVGHDNTFGHPHQEMLNALQGVRIFRTDLDGAIKISESEKSLVIKTYRDFQFQRARSLKEEMKNIKRLFETW
jgi:competence protein ComEC